MTDDDPHHDELLDRFRHFYGATGADALVELERRVLGGGYGGTSYTTLDQALELVELLDLREDLTLLDIGSGAGWPGLLLGHESGCRVVLTDIPLEGLGVARIRAAAESIDSSAIAASGVMLPFRDRCFDAVTHSDVLC